MDLRLMDEIVQFMDHDGLTNRYDHVILAGAALGAIGPTRRYAHWWQTFKDHMEIAYKLRKFKDVYILEHRDCGAYREFLPNQEGVFGENEAEADREKWLHLKYAEQLRKKIETWARRKEPEIRVKSFLMDLRGRVEIIDR